MSPEQKMMTCQVWCEEGTWYAHCPELGVTTTGDASFAARAALVPACNQRLLDEAGLFEQIIPRSVSSFFVRSPQ